jgi:type IV pilus assembly protein PilB
VREDIQKLTRRRLGGILMSEGLITPEQVTEALEKQKETGKPLGEILIELGYITENSLVKILSMQFQFPFISPQNYEISKEVLELLPAELMYKHLFIPLDKFSNILTVAMGGLFEEAVVQEIKKITGCDVRIYISPPSLVRKALERFVPLELTQSAVGNAAPETDAEEKPVVVLEHMKTKKQVIPQFRKGAPPAPPPSTSQEPEDSASTTPEQESSQELTDDE